MCSNGVETDFHLLIKCPVAKEIWTAFKVGDHSAGTISIAHWWNKMRTQFSSDQLDMVTMVIWFIWLNRNKRVWRNKQQPSVVVVQEAHCSLLEWKEVRKQDNVPRSRVQPHNSGWKKQEVGLKKCNVDAGLFPEDGKVGYGCVVRDDTGRFVAGMQGLLIGLFSPSVAEAMGIREALSWLKRSGIDQVVLESDALGVINAINNDTVDESEHDVSLMIVKFFKENLIIVFSLMFRNQRIVLLMFWQGRHVLCLVRSGGLIVLLRLFLMYW